MHNEADQMIPRRINIPRPLPARSPASRYDKEEISIWMRSWFSTTLFAFAIDLIQIIFLPSAFETYSKQGEGREVADGSLC